MLAEKLITLTLILIGGIALGILISKGWPVEVRDLPASILVFVAFFSALIGIDSLRSMN